MFVQMVKSKVKSHFLVKLSPVFEKIAKVLDINATLDRICLTCISPVYGFARVAVVRYVKLSTNSLAIVGLLKPTEALGYCEVCPSCLPEKVHLTLFHMGGGGEGGRFCPPSDCLLYNFR